MARERRRWAGPGTRAALAYGAFASLAALAWVLLIDPWWLQPVNLTTFWWSLPGLVVVPVALLRRRLLVAAACLPALFVWVGAYGGMFVPSSSPSAPADDVVRVMTFNTFVQATGTDHVVHEVERHEPDVVLLQEVFPERETQVRRRLERDFPHMRSVQSPGIGGLMVLSRYPVTEVGDVGEPSSSSRSTELVVLDVDGRPLQVVPVHLISPCPSCGSSLTARLDFEEEVRRLEVGAVLRALRPGIPAVVAGDFNSNERSGPYRRLARAGFLDPQRLVGSGPGFTWPNDGPTPVFLRIDQVLVRGLVPVDAFVGDGGPSDHRPVVVDVAFPEDER